MNKNKNCHARLEKDCQARDDENRNSVGTGFQIKKLPQIGRQRKFKIQNEMHRQPNRIILLQRIQNPFHHYVIESES